MDDEIEDLDSNFDIQSLFNNNENCERISSPMKMIEENTIANRISLQKGVKMINIDKILFKWMPKSERKRRKFILNVNKLISFLFLGTKDEFGIFYFFFFIPEISDLFWMFSNFSIYRKCTKIQVFLIPDKP